MGFLNTDDRVAPQSWFLANSTSAKDSQYQLWTTNIKQHVKLIQLSARSNFAVSHQVHQYWSCLLPLWTLLLVQVIWMLPKNAYC
jgi:hypothetical protein